MVGSVLVEAPTLLGLFRKASRQSKVMELGGVSFDGGAFVLCRKKLIEIVSLGQCLRALSSNLKEYVR